MKTGSFLLILFILRYNAQTQTRDNQKSYINIVKLLATSKFTNELRIINKIHFNNSIPLYHGIIHSRGLHFFINLIYII
jgi:hypothetical protein